MYFNSDQVAASFKRLSSRKQTGKSHLERTSGLMYFLAFDSVCKTEGADQLDFNPEKTEGCNNRKAIELEFTKLVLLDRSHGHIRQVSELGKIDTQGKDPEKKISSNFLTVPLTKASKQVEPYYYPKRPAPLMKLGSGATGIKWGIGYHEEWQKNLPIIASDIIQPTPFTDLAIFVLRDTEFDDGIRNYLDASAVAINKRFSAQLSQFWIKRIEQEKVMVRHIVSPFSKTYAAFAKTDIGTPSSPLSKMNKNALISHVTYLEGVLTANKIKFDQPK